ncbi:MAG: hypothetical protein AAGG48_23375 [Planctomycetota bacterium]
MAIERYRTALNFGRDAGPQGLLNAYGFERTRELMTRYSRETSDIVFDGSDRWAQVLRVPHAYGEGLGDGYTLFSLSDGTSCNWTLPKGAVLRRIRFTGDEVTFQIHGTITQGSFEYVIPEGDPAEFRLAWNRGTPLPRTFVGELMSKHYCVESNRAN